MVGEWRVLLGDIVCKEGLLVDPRNITVITSILTPTNVTKVKRFLGAAGFS